MYNEEVKLYFLESNYKSEDSRNVVKYVFEKSELSERILKKDLYMFTLDEIRLTVLDMGYSSLNTVRNTISIIKNYIDWSETSGYRHSNTNVLASVDDEWLNKLTVKRQKTLIRIDEFEEIKSHIVNENDKLMLDLLWNGVFGKELSEIRTLQVSNIEGNTVKLFDKDGSSREIELCEDIIKRIYAVNDLKEELDLNGNVQPLNITDYVFKHRVKKDNNHDIINYSYVLRRIKDILEPFKDYKLTAKSFYNSGMIHKYYEALKERNGGKLDLNNPAAIKPFTDLELIGLLSKQYGWKSYGKKNEYVVYGISNYTRNFLNLNTIVEIYNKNQ